MSITGVVEKFYRATLKFFARFRKKKVPVGGYVWAPYIPLQVTKIVLKPEDFAVRKGIMTNYSKKSVRSDYYGTVNVADLGKKK